MARELTYNQTVERSIIKTYRKSIWNPFVEACKNYRLVNEGDRIAVCISGGKDSVLLAKCLQQLKRVSDTQFELMFICMDPGYNEMNRKMIEENCKNLEIPVRIFESDIFSVTEHVGGSPCYLCARMRRGHLYARAKELGAIKLLWVIICRMLSKQLLWVCFTVPSCRQCFPSFIQPILRVWSLFVRFIVLMRMQLLSGVILITLNFCSAPAALLMNIVILKTA